MKKYKVTYFSPKRQKNCKKDVASLREAQAFIKAKGLKVYGIWKLYRSKG